MPGLRLGPHHLLSPHTWGWTRCDGSLRKLRRTLSPHTWGWTAFRRAALPDDRRCPHTRGGGPAEFPFSICYVALSPHTWGWTDDRLVNFPDETVVPTHVGVDRALQICRAKNCRCPHTRGGGPHCDILIVGLLSCPHTRGGGPVASGTTRQSRRCPHTRGGGPPTPSLLLGQQRCPHTRGGGPATVITEKARQRCPHTRGGGPETGTLTWDELTLSPHTWGWTEPAWETSSGMFVVPTHVGVDRQHFRSWSFLSCCPHTRGGGPPTSRSLVTSSPLSPHTWGWTGGGWARLTPTCVVPTHVGVDRSNLIYPYCTTGCPHTRGGGPYPGSVVDQRYPLSPHTWGWTGSSKTGELMKKLSPHTWGWTALFRLSGEFVARCPHTRGGGPFRLLHCEFDAAVVPTHVGVDREKQTSKLGISSCPHTRGGGPESPTRIWPSMWLSPHTWGWTALYHRIIPLSRVVPTHVGVDRDQGHWLPCLDGCPHTRGGGPPASLLASMTSPLSPHTWGWTESLRQLHGGAGVVPTHVGVDRARKGQRAGLLRCPHTRGGGPIAVIDTERGSGCPHTRGGGPLARA